jgi:hypothetical protein
LGGGVSHLYLVTWHLLFPGIPLAFIANVSTAVTAAVLELANRRRLSPWLALVTTLSCATWLSCYLLVVGAPWPILDWFFD